MMLKKRLLYNNDGSYILGSAEPGRLTRSDVQSFVDRVADTQVTTYLICANSLLMHYPSNIERAIGCLRPGQDAGSDAAAHEEPFDRYRDNLLALAKTGTDIIEICVEQARRQGMEGFVSMRMNDLHFTDPEIYHPQSQSDFWLENPNCYVGSHEGWHADGALNFARRKVREYKLRIIEELMRRYRPDGLELDFMRFPVYFPTGQGPRHQQTMTEFIAAARDLVTPAELLVRVPARLASCHQLGLAPDSWAHRELVDAITVAPFCITDPLLPVAGFRNTIGKDTVPVYAGIDSGVYFSRQIMTHGLYRGAAGMIHDQGADGIYLFNFNFSGKGDVVKQGCGLGAARSLLMELGSPRTLRNRNTIYSLGEALSEYGIPHNSRLPCKLPAKVPFPLPAGLQSPRTARLILRLHGQAKTWGRFNQHDFEPLPGAGYPYNQNLDKSEQALVAEIPAPHLKPGSNSLKLEAEGEKEIHLLRAELVCEYGSAMQAGRL